MQKPLNAIGDDGQNVDWWFIYKVPKDAMPSAKASKGGSKATGYEYVYFDNGSKVLAGSKHKLNDPTSALYLTLKEFLGGATRSGGYVFYNDEYPSRLKTPNNGERGHCKGVLAFDHDTDSAIWLLHSTPRFPDPENFQFPSEELDYGQTFLCITLKDAKTAEAIAQQMLSQQGPQTYGARLPDASPVVWTDLSNARYTLSKTPSDIAFASKGGAHFRSIAKSQLWGDDLWSDLVGPALKTNLDVESWRRGTIPGTADNDKTHNVEDVTAIDLSPLGVPYAWPETKDHAKWATSLKGEGDWVCVADINRQSSQSKRGGGTICFQHTGLWQCLAQIDQVVPPKAKR